MQNRRLKWTRRIELYIKTGGALLKITTFLNCIYFHARVSNTRSERLTIIIVIYNKKLKIADNVVRISNDRPLDPLDGEDAYHDFVCDGPPDIIVHGHNTGIPEPLLKTGNKVFASGTFWDVYKTEDHTIINLSLPYGDRTPYCSACFKDDFRTGDIFCAVSEKGGRELHSHPLAFPLFHLLMISYLGRHEGVVVHACGIDDGGVGYLFPGSSTYGKTTMARLWQDEAVVLNDERIVLRKNGGRFWIYGTPWHGEFEKISPHGVPLENIFFLQKGDLNSVGRVNGSLAVSHFLSHCFLPYWVPQGIEHILDTCSHLAKSIPMHVLEFVPDKNIIDFIRCVK